MEPESSLLATPNVSSSFSRAFFPTYIANPSDEMNRRKDLGVVPDGPFPQLSARGSVRASVR